MSLALLLSLSLKEQTIPSEPMKSLRALSCSLKVEGSSIPQTIAQLRYVGRAHTIYGDSNLEAAMIDALLEGLTELGNKLVPAMKAVRIPV